MYFPSKKRKSPALPGVFVSQHCIDIDVCLCLITITLIKCDDLSSAILAGCKSNVKGAFSVLLGELLTPQVQTLFVGCILLGAIRFL